jgi:molecular chaperone GrpE
MADTETPRIDPTPEAAGLPEEGMPSPDEAADGLLPNDGARPVDDGEAQPALNLEESAIELGLELPDDPAEAAALLLRALLESRREAGEYLEVMQRVAADFENYRKRVERDHTENIRRASQRLVERLLPALDSFDAALAYEAQSPAQEKILAGMRGTHSQLMEILAAEGLTAIPAAGKAFDPAVHEAVGGPDGEGHGPLVVAQELRRGYVMTDRVVRPSLVVVEHG